MTVMPHPAIPRSWIVALALLGGGLTGCFGGKNPDARCNDVAEYQLATSIPLVVVPDGLSAPNRGTGYVIPLPAANSDIDGVACLARPPDYFRKDAGAPLGVTPAQ